MNSIPTIAATNGIGEFIADGDFYMANSCEKNYACSRAKLVHVT